MNGQKIVGCKGIHVESKRPWMWTLRVQLSGVAMRRGWYLAVLGAVGLLTGCGNAYQHLTMGEWREVGQAEPPIPPEKRAFLVTTLVPGEGPPVLAGDLVKARVTVTTVDGTGRTSHNPPPQVVWLWTGRGPPSSSEPEAVKDFGTYGKDFGTYGMLGGAQYRVTFIGRRLHEQFEFHLKEGASPEVGDLPVRVFIDDPYSRMHDSFDPLKWPALSMRDAAGGRPSARIEILEICRDARLYRRTAILTQYGAEVSWGDGPEYQTKRQGTLGWSALEAKCPAPDGLVRFQAGPFYYFDMKDEAHLSAWDVSYEALRPPHKHPDERGDQ